jgi:hypothetical protein
VVRSIPVLLPRRNLNRIDCVALSCWNQPISSGADSLGRCIKPWHRLAPRFRCGDGTLCRLGSSESEEVIAVVDRRVGHHSWPNDTRVLRRCGGSFGWPGRGWASCAGRTLGLGRGITTLVFPLDAIRAGGERRDLHRRRSSRRRVACHLWRASHLPGALTSGELSFPFPVKHSRDNLFTLQIGSGGDRRQALELRLDAVG